MRQVVQFALALLVLSVAGWSQTPVINKTFSSDMIQLGGNVQLQFVIINAGAVAAVNVGAVDILPHGLAISTPNGLVGSCGGGTITATAGEATIILSGATLAAGTDCIFSVGVKGVAVGPQTNSVMVTSSAGNGNTATASITVVGVAGFFLPIATEADGVYQVRYLSNLLIGDSYINLTNTGVVDAFDPAGRICVNVYTFDPSEELISCCACPVTPDGLVSLSAKNDLVSNTLTPGVPSSVMVKLLSTLPINGTCNASSPSANLNGTNLVKGMKAWATTLHQNTTNGTYTPSDTEFAKSDLSGRELTKLTQYCGFIQANGSTFGICKSCRFGGLGGASQ